MGMEMMEASVYLRLLSLLIAVCEIFRYCRSASSSVQSMFYLSNPFRVIKGSLVHMDTEDQMATRSDSTTRARTHTHTHTHTHTQTHTHTHTSLRSGGLVHVILIFLLYCHQGNKGVRGVVGVPGYIVSTDDLTN